MRLKSYLFIIVLLALPFSAVADDAAELKQQVMLDQKRLVVMENMVLSTEEGEVFWPIYDKHQEKLLQVNKQAAKLIVAYASVYQTLTDEQALKIIDEFFAVRSQRQQVLQDLANELEKVLSGKKVFRYLQIENKLEAITRFELASGIPLAQ